MPKTHLTKFNIYQLAFKIKKKKTTSKKTLLTDPRIEGHSLNPIKGTPHPTYRHSIIALFFKVGNETGRFLSLPLFNTMLRGLGNSR